MELEREQAPDRRIEHLVSEIGQVIDQAGPERKEELRQMAAGLMRDSLEQTRSAPEEHAAASRRPLNAASLGLFLIVLGLAFSVLLAPIGMLLFGAGAAMVLIGILHRAVIK